MLLTHKHPREGVVIICPDGTRILVRIIKPADQRSERTTLGVGAPP